MTSVPPERPDQPDHEPTVDFGAAEPTKPLPPPPPPPAQEQPVQPPPVQPPPPPGPPPGYGAYGPTFGAPYGIDPVTGLPFSDKSKLVAGLLQILVPLGIGRFYTGHTGLGIAQLLVTVLTCGVGAVWPFVDGIVILVSNPRDATGRPLRS